MCTIQGLRILDTQAYHDKENVLVSKVADQLANQVKHRDKTNHGTDEEVDKTVI